VRLARDRTVASPASLEGNGAGGPDAGSAGARPAEFVPGRADRDTTRKAARAGGRRAVAIALALTILAAAAWALLGSSLLVVRHIRVTGGGGLVSAADVRSAAAIPLGLPLARVDGAAAVRRVERLAPVLSARVSRSFPDTVVISVRQRIPALAVAVRSGYALVDAAGVTVEVVRSAPGGLPLLTAPPPVVRGSPAVRAAAEVVLGLPAQLRARVRSVSASASSVTLQLSGGVTVTWGGPAQMAQKAAELDLLLLRAPARYYDVSDPATAVTQG
jgi:cell division protein FtsQ